MAVMYPKRSRVPSLDATSMDWQRAADIVFHDHAESRSAGAKRSREPGMVFRIMLPLLLGWCLIWAIQHRHDALAADAAMAAQSWSEGGAAMPDMSEADAGLLRSLPRRLEDACERNTSSLGLQECRTRLRERGGACLAPVARRYPGRSGEPDHMAPIVNAYLHCVFGGGEPGGHPS
jgi:hypothetical protein